MGSADFLEFAAKAGLYKAHAEAWTTSISAENFYSKPTGIFAKISSVKQSTASTKKLATRNSELATIKNFV